MDLSGTRKAAMLLLSLDPANAAELLKTAEPEVVTEIAAELAYLKAGGDAGQRADIEPVREFFDLLNESRGRRQDGNFVQEMVQRVVGAEKAREVLGKVADLVGARDPFLPIRSADVREIAAAIAGESAQVASLVLSELPPAKSAGLLRLLEENVRADAVRGMTSGQRASPQTRARVASAVLDRLKGTGGGAAAVSGQEHLRKVAVLLRDLAGEMRDSLLKGIIEHDAETGKIVQNLMVIWEDVMHVADRSLQEVLRKVDSKQMALSLVGADGSTAARFRANISERARAMLEEESSLLSSPKAEEIEAARQDILERMREMNAEGNLEFEEN